MPISQTCALVCWTVLLLQIILLIPVHPLPPDDGHLPQEGLMGVGIEQTIKAFV